MNCNANTRQKKFQKNIFPAFSFLQILRLEGLISYAHVMLYSVSQALGSMPCNTQIFRILVGCIEKKSRRRTAPNVFCGGDRS